MADSNKLIQTLMERGRLSVFSGNMFDVAIFGRDQDKKDEALQFPKSWLYCSAITLGSPELKYKGRHPLTKQQLIEGVQLQDTVSITWLEDKYLQVWNYHRNWLTYFYDPAKDQFRSGAYGKKRTAEIYLQEMKSPKSPNYSNVGINKGTNRSGEAGSVQHFLVFEGLMPIKIPDLSLNWDSDNSNFTQIQIQYRFDTLKYQIARGDASTVDEAKEKSRTWQPKDSDAKIVIEV